MNINSILLKWLGPARNVFRQGKVFQSLLDKIPRLTLHQTSATHRSPSRPPSLSLTGCCWSPGPWRGAWRCRYMVRDHEPEPEQSRGIPGESLTRKITTNPSLLVGEKLTESLIQLDLIVVWRLLRNFYIIHCIVGTEGGPGLTE